MAKFQYGPSGQIASAAEAQGLDINSLMAGWVDRGAWTYYDRVIQPLSGTGSTSGNTLYQTYTPFQNGINTQDTITGQNKSKYWTNLPNGRFFNPPRCLVLQRIGIYFEPSMLLADVEMILANAYFEFKIDDKVFFEGLLTFHPAGMGLAGFSDKQSEGVWTNGVPSPHATRSFGNYAKYIAPLQNFSFTMVLPSTMAVTNTIGGTTPGTNPGGAPTLTASGSGGTGINMVFMLDGLTDRSVQ
jgi:hypothetical protein